MFDSFFAGLIPRMPALLKKNGVYTHPVTDHFHYFEDGGVAALSSNTAALCLRSSG